MPTNLLPFADTEIRMRYREPFLTEGLDLKLAVNTPPGLYRGFRLGVSGANLTVQVNGDSSALDHCAVYQGASGHSLTLRKTGGNFNLDLSTYASKTVVLAIYAAYALGADTAAEIRAYELSPSDEFTGASERPELVVLGTVVIPAAGTIPAANITHDRRTMSWEQVAPEARTWAPLLKNGSFEISETGATHVRASRHWSAAVSPSAGGTFTPSTTDANTGLKSLQFSYVSGTPTGVVTQPVNVPVTPGQQLRAQVFVKAQQALTLGSCAMAFTWRDGASTVVATTTVAIPLTGVDSSYRKIESTFIVPTSPSGILSLAEVQIQLTGVSFGSAGAAVRFDDLQVYVESQSVTGQFLFHEKGRNYEVLQDLLFEDQGTWVQDAIALRFANGTGLIGERKDQSTVSAAQPFLDWKGRLQLGANLVDTEAKALTGRLSTPVSTAVGVDYTLMWSAAGSGLATARLYVSSTTGAIILTDNASFDGANWVKDINGQEAFRIEIARNQFRVQHQVTGTNTWTDANWLVGSSLTNGALSLFLGTVASAATFNPTQVAFRLGAGVDQFLFTTAAMTHDADILPAQSNTFSLGSTSAQLLKMWSRALSIGPNPTDSFRKAIGLKSDFNFPTQTEQVEFDYVSRYFGIWTRRGHRFVQEWDANTALPNGWQITTSGTVVGTTLGNQHRVTVSHTGATAGTHTVYTVNTIKFRLTDGFVCRIRCNNGLGADFTAPRIGFIDVGGSGNGITFGPATVDGGGSHNYNFLVGAGSTAVGGPGDHAFTSGQKWLTFACIGSRLFWSVDETDPDDLQSTPSDTFPTVGSASITVPTGLYHFAIQAQGGGGGFGSSITVDYVEIITGNRDS